MTKYREILRLTALGLSLRNIAASIGVSQKTIIKVQRRAKEISLSWPLESPLSDADLERILFPKEQSAVSKKRMPDYSYIRKELLKNGVNKKLLWTEYLEECRQAGDDPLMYSQFCYHIQQEEQKRNATMHIPRKPGQQVEVDWAGDPAQITDPMTGECTPARIFVGVMTYSQYAFVEAFINEKQRAWNTAHVHMFEFLGGVPPILVSDNAPTATDRKQSDRYNPTLIRAYEELAEHYNTAIIPARVRAPKDKPNAEGNVGHVSTWIIAALRNEQFFSLAELNAAIREKLRAYNEAPFEKKEGSRLSLFLGEEKPLLAPLPATRYELAEYKAATVQFNYHIAVDGMYYSVPYQYIKAKVDVRVTDTTIEVFNKNERIASHKRLYGRPGQYSTVTQHMPDSHQKFLEWNGDRFREWAKRIGVNTYKAVDSILSSSRVEQQSYRACMGLLRLAEKKGAEKLEAACAKALQYTNTPSYKGIKNLLAASKDSSQIPSESVEDKNGQYGITRGARHYGGDRS
ncbi:MAG: IS21 family transposase [Clostridia bacterium]|nr:IS21 family transposase [Clostridia bacterium]